MGAKKVNRRNSARGFVLLSGLLLIAACVALTVIRGSFERRTVDDIRSPEPINLRGFHALVLLSNVPVQEDIGLSSKQRVELHRIRDRFLTEVGHSVEEGRALGQLAPDQREEVWQRVRELQEQAVASSNRHALDLLSPAQRKRLGQIALQLRLEEAFYEKDVVEKLNLQPAQRDAIAQARAQFLRTASELSKKVRSKEITSRQWKQDVEELRVAQRRRYEELLNPSQHTVYDGLRGKLIDFSRSELREDVRPGRDE